MNAQKITALLAALMLTGCATCTRYPVPCGIVTVLAAGSIAATIEAHTAGRGEHGPGFNPRFGFCTNPKDAHCHSY